jgi:hypothetical protein
VPNGFKEYERLYHFKEPLESKYNLEADTSYSKTLLEKLSRKVIARGMSFDFPNLVAANWVERNTKSYINKNQLALTDYM